MTKKEWIERREYWKTGHGALMSMCKAVELTAKEISKFEGVDRAATMRDLHARLSPMFKTVSRLMRQALTNEQVDADPELRRLRAEIDEEEMSDPYEYDASQEPPTGPAAPGVQQPLDEEPMDHLGNKRNVKPFSKAFTGWPMGASRVMKQAPTRRARIL